MLTLRQVKNFEIYFKISRITGPMFSSSSENYNCKSKYTLVTGRLSVCMSAKILYTAGSIFREYYIGQSIFF